MAVLAKMLECHDGAWMDGVPLPLRVEEAVLRLGVGSSLGNSKQ